MSRVANLDWLVEVMGEDSTKKLLLFARSKKRSRSNRYRIYVPLQECQSHPLRAALGEQAFSSLQSQFGGKILELPKGDQFLNS